MFKLSTEQHQSFHFYTLTLFCFCLPINSRFAALCIVFVFINGLLSGAIWKNKIALFQPLPLLFFSWFLIHLFGMLYTSNTLEGWRDIETKLSLFIFPLILFTLPIHSKTKRKILLNRFIQGCFVASLLCLLISTYVYWTTGRNTFYYQYLSGHLGFNPAYFSMYFGFAVFIIAHRCIPTWNSLPGKKRILNVSLMVYFMGFILLLSSRMLLLALLVLLSLAFLFYMYQQRKILQGICLMLVGLFAISALAWTIPKTKMRLQVAIKSVIYPSSENNKPNIRLRIWNAAIEVAGKNLFFGQGTGDIQDNLTTIYKERNYTTALEKNLNTHNQYLQTSIGLGLIGLLILVANFLWPTIIAFQQQNYLYAFFLILFILGMLTESMLESQQGVMFYAFFNSFFASNDDKE